MNSVLLWLFVTLFCIAVQGFYSMLEMAAISFNRVRLQYYVSKKVKRAEWLHYLLQKPSRLFGTVMLGVNVALQVGSQASRELYLALGLDPDFAPITQVLLVVIFAELVPLFAARHFSENVVMLGIPIIYATHHICVPFIWILGKITNIMHRLFGKKTEEFDLFISREELQKVLESHEEEDEFNVIVANIFSLRTKTAASVMTPLSQMEIIAAGTTIGELRIKLSESPQPYVPLYHKTKANIVAIALARDLVRLGDNRYARDFARTPWFITQETKLMQILSQFRSNRQSVAVVLDPNGNAVGMLTLDIIMEEIFGEHPQIEADKKRVPLIHRTFPGNTKIADFNREYHANLNAHSVETLAQLMMALLDHNPAPGDAIVVDEYELIAEETTLLGIKSITVKTIEV